MNYRKILSKDPNFLSVEPNNKRKIQQIRKLFGGKIPPSYERFLVEVGYGGVAGFEVTGTGGDEKAVSIIQQSELYHGTDPHLPKNYVFLMDIGDDVSWYFDTSTRRKDGECKVVGWISGLTKEQQPAWVKEQEVFETFEEFFKAKVSETQKYVGTKEKHKNDPNPVTAKNYLFRDIKDIYTKPMAPEETKKFMFWTIVFLTVVYILLKLKVQTFGLIDIGFILMIGIYIPATVINKIADRIRRREKR